MNLQDVLKRDKKYTLAKFSEKGFLLSEQFVFEFLSIKVIDQQMKYTIVKAGAVHELKWHKFIRLEVHEQFVLWEGYQKVDTSICAHRSISNKGSSLTVFEQRWPTFNPRYILKAIGSVKTTPIAHYSEPLDPEILLNFQAISEKQ